MADLTGENVVVLLFILGSLGQFVKLGEFLVVPDQQKKIDKVMKRVHGRLAAVQPFQVVRFLNSGPGTAFLAIPLVVIVLFFLTSVVHSLYFEQILTWEWSLSFIGDALKQFITLLAGFAIIAYLSYNAWKSSLSSMLRREGFKPFLRSFGKVAGLFVVTTVPFTVLMAITINEYPGEPSTVVMIATFIAFMVFAFIGLPYLAPTLSGLLAFVVWGLAQIALFIIRLIRAVTFRIVQYQKGALQAILLLVTVLLGLITLYLKFLKG